MLKVKTKGFDKAKRNLDRLGQNLRKLDGRHEMSFRELYPPAFMRANTQHESFEALLEASPFTVETAEDFAAIPDEPWDAFIRQATSFESWEVMQKAAVREYARRKMLEGIR